LVQVTPFAVTDTVGALAGALADAAAEAGATATASDAAAVIMVRAVMERRRRADMMVSSLTGR
jgi:hypothetical protein